MCFDEQSRQLTKETRRAIPAAPGRPARVDYEYERNGTANLFMIFEPLSGKRRVKVTDRRTALDFAKVIRELVDSYPTAEKVVLVMDNLNTHKMASLYEAFAPDEARRLIDRLEVHYTPKHGSWLNMAETELSVMTKQCLRRRIPASPHWSARLPHGNPRETPPNVVSTGVLPPPTPESNSNVRTRQFRSVEALV